jgi:hypothetical protein
MYLVKFLKSKNYHNGLPLVMTTIVVVFAKWKKDDALNLHEIVMFYIIAFIQF